MMTGFVLAAALALGAPAAGTNETFEIPWKGRSICIDPPATTNLDRFCAFVRDRLGPDGFGTLILRIDYRYRFESHPECRGRDPLSKEDAAKIVASCRGAGVKLVPKINLFGHQAAGKDGKVKAGILAAHPEWDESIGRGNVRDDARHSVCPLVSEARQIALDLALETVAAFESDTFHFGCDEVFEIGYCERCRKVSSAQGNGRLFAGWVNGLAAGLKARGVKPMIWADRLISMDLTGGKDFWESSDNGTWTALPFLDRDIVLCDWRYWPRETYPSVDVFQGAGFRMWACVWNSVPAAKEYLGYARKHDCGSILGVMLTSWYGADGFLDAFDGKSGADKSKGEVEVYRLLVTGQGE